MAQHSLVRFHNALKKKKKRWRHNSNLHLQPTPFNMLGWALGYTEGGWTCILYFQRLIFALFQLACSITVLPTSSFTQFPNVILHVSCRSKSDRCCRRWEKVSKPLSLERIFQSLLRMRDQSGYKYGRCHCAHDFFFIKGGIGCWTFICQ